MTEHELQAETIALARRLQLKGLAIPDSKRILYGRGWPDLTIVGPREVAFFELKSEGGKLSREQAQLKYALEASGHYFTTLRPVDWASGRVERELRRIAG